MERNNNVSSKSKESKEPVSMNFESYLEDDILHNLNFRLSPLEFNLLRIYKYLYIGLKGMFTSLTNYVINGNQITKFISTSRIEFKTLYFKNQISFNKDFYIIQKQARCFTFHHDDKEDLRFITDQNNLKSVLKEYNMSTFYVKTEQDLNISIDDVCSVFEDENINELFAKSKKKILSEDNFNKRFSNDLNIIKDISFNSKLYFEKSYNTPFIKNIYDNLFENIFRFLSSGSKILYLFGPRSSGKSVFLNFLSYSLFFQKYGSLYLNFSAIKKSKTMKNIKNLLYHELLYLICKKEEIEDLYNIKPFKGISYNNDPLVFIYYFLENLIKKYDNNKFSEELVVIIIDDLFIYDISFEFDTIEKIFGLIDKNERFKIIISGEGKFFVEKLKKFFVGRDGCKEDYILINEINKEILKINENKPKDDAINEELIYLNNFSISDLFYCNNLNGKTLNYLQLKQLNMISVLPNYLTLKFWDTHKEIKFVIQNTIFSEALNKKIAYNIQKSE